jgi:hypothetical protein
MQAPREAGAGASAAQCVLWCDPAGPVPPALASTLAAKGVEVVRIGGPHAALAEICLAARSGGARHVILLFVEPRGLPMAADVQAAAARLAPRAAFWRYEETANPRLAAVVESEVPRGPRAAEELGPAEAPPVRPVRVGGAPALRLAGEGAAPASDEGDGVPARQLLTAEELAMLLADDGPGESLAR